ncbi:CPA1 family monovalent cation:H+ antiporter [Rhodopseudomonas julia]|uniref:CPA1 family monovalent cation:H+ antiporter n=1 Tax=Rhodopseudomonas julia TaxID=200617 RepID=A0ABU0C872_9BRAD|nr:sodium:proton antiporter [Rhodopseudomonas julia]MDQ0326716.1 CPA1 family monovalent cation:H+ antiporter [Rhodopseudomonas julia]
MLSLFDISALLLVLSALFGWVNVRFIRLPHTIGMLLMALFASLAIVAFDVVVPGSHVREAFTETIRQIDFFDTLMHGMLAFLLFAGALHVDFGLLRSERWAVGLMASLGVLISTVIIGFGFYFGANLLGVDLSLPWAFVFGALISPTDPVAVLSLLKSVRVPETLEVKIAGESLFNDGVGIVVFTVLLAIAAGGGEIEPLHIGEIFLLEAGGGALLGFVGGWIAVRLMQSIDHYPVEILLSLALVTGLYAAALALHMSGPIAVVVAGLLVGNRGQRTAMSEETKTYLFHFWEVIDELLNSVLFLLIGLEVLIVATDPELALFALAAIPLVLVARFVSVFLPITLLALKRTFTSGSIAVLTWGGVRGGISVALALSLPDVPAKQPILLTTYAVVIFSIVVQGLTIRSLIRRVVFT